MQAPPKNKMIVLDGEYVLLRGMPVPLHGTQQLQKQRYQQLVVESSIWNRGFRLRHGLGRRGWHEQQNMSGDSFSLSSRMKQVFLVLVMALPVTLCHISCRAFSKLAKAKGRRSTQIELAHLSRRWLLTIPNLLLTGVGPMQAGWMLPHASHGLVYGSCFLYSVTGQEASEKVGLGRL